METAGNQSTGHGARARCPAKGPANDAFGHGSQDHPSVPPTLVQGCTVPGTIVVVTGSGVGSGPCGHGWALAVDNA